MSDIRNEPFVEIFSYVASGAAAGQIEYHGQARPGVGSDTANWRLRKYTYNSDGQLTNVQWASGSRSFDKIYDDRATYTYS